MTYLETILKRAQEIQCLTHPSSSTSLLSLASQSRPQPIANIAFPDPLPLQPALTAAGARPEISQAMDQAYQKRAADLRTLYHSAITLVCSNQAQYSTEFRRIPTQKVVSSFTKLYLRELVAWREECVDAYLKHPSAGNKTLSSSCTPKFNHVSPVLPCLIRPFIMPLAISS